MQRHLPEQTQGEYIMSYTISYRADSVKLIYPLNYSRILGTVKAKYTREFKKVTESGIQNNINLINDIEKKEKEAIRKKLSEITKGIEYQGELITDRIIIDTFYCMAELSYGDVITNAREAIEIARNI